MSTRWIKNAAVVQEQGVTEGCYVTIENGKITAVGPDAEGSVPAGGDVVDAGGCYLVPGFIDLHIHGSGDFLIDNGPRDLSELCMLLTGYGVTGFLPTVCPRPKGEDADFLRTLSAVKSEGASILGFHLEGPFLTITGALPKEALGDADPDRVRALMDAAGPYRAVFSIAPDFEDVVGLIKIMAKDGAPVFITHTRADVEQTKRALDEGARHATHFYDVFYVPDEKDGGVRPCGAVEAILADPRASVDFILDGEHVDPVAVSMALRAKGASKVCLITDAQVGAGKPPGRYMFGKEEVEYAYPGGPARMTENARSPRGLSGSGLTMVLALRNAIKMLGVDLPQAVRMVSTNPAGVLGLEASKGRIEAGYDADIVLLNRELEVVQTWVGGERRFVAKA